VGLDHTTAKEVFGSFLAKSSYTVDQINFINLVINDLAQNGVVTAARFYDAPYTAISAVGPQALFTPEQIQEIDDLLESVRRNAMYETKP
jgi:type I restriction enzyme R subunit